MNKVSKICFLASLVALLVIGICGQTARPGALDNELQELAATERAFSATAVKEGFRDSFIKFFADDGIGFSPQPQRTRETLLASPAPTAPRTVVFNWQPMFGDISLAGDLGYTTGPVLYTDITENPKPARHGMYFSVWQKQSDGAWRVVADMGTSVPLAAASTDVAFSPADRRDVLTKGGLSDASYADLDAKLSDDIGKLGTAKAYSNWLNSEFRLHRGGHLPIITKQGVAEYFAANPQDIAYQFIGGKPAKSNDLAFTYGSFRKGPANSVDVDGYYVHVWRKNRSGKWKLVADVMNELPKK